MIKRPTFSTLFMRMSLALGGLLPLVPVSTSAQSAAHEVVDARARLLHASGGVNGPLAPILDASVGEEGFGASLRFSTDDVERWIGEVEKAGVRVHRRADGTTVCIGRICGAHVPFASLPLLETVPGLSRVEAAWRPLVRRPLMDTIGQIDAFRAQDRAMDQRLTGEGVIIADLDQAFDIFHPAFFRADGAFVSWIDVNESGTFDRGDALDVDGDGEAGDDETMAVLDGTEMYWDAVQFYEENRDGEFQPGADWVYLDANGNGERDFGSTAGFFERDATYGEALFIADDVNANGFVDAGERFIALGESKVQALIWGEVAFERGSDLVFADPAADLQDDDGNRLLRSHGTGVAGILAAGHAGRFDNTGVAPDAELLSLVARYTQDGEGNLTVMQAAQQRDADIMIHEYSSWNFTALDGSTNVEVAMDTLRDEGMLQVNPAGNLANSGKHTIAQVTEDGVEVSIVVPERAVGQTVGAALISLHWPADAGEPELELVSPGGDILALGEGVPDGVSWFDNHVVYDTPDVTPEGMRTRYIYLGSEDGQIPMRSGTYRVRAVASGAPFEMHAFVDDYFSSWGRGVGVLDEVPATTLCWPSTANSAFTVGAYAGVHANPDDGEGSEPGELRYYSSRGPRIDGERGIDIVAPDDPMSPTSEGYADIYEHGWYSKFGGTSGAGPHVAGALALLVQDDPSATPDELEQRLIDAVLQDGFTPNDLPNPEWGHGKLRIAPALLEPLRPNNETPILTAAPRLSQDMLIDVSGSQDADGDTLTFEVDLDYDGLVDLRTTDTELRLPTQSDPWTAVIRVYDGHGGSAGVVVTGVLGEERTDLAPDAGGGTGADAGEDIAVDAGTPDTDDTSNVGTSDADTEQTLDTDLPFVTQAQTGCSGAGLGASPAALVVWLGVLLNWHRRRR
ncbi:MAG: subtilisin family serine protease [Flavobacteriales bacterium]|jgi:subtilisin family serine protease